MCHTKAATQNGAPASTTFYIAPWPAYCSGGAQSNWRRPPPAVAVRGAMTYAAKRSWYNPYLSKACLVFVVIDAKWSTP